MAKPKVKEVIVVEGRYDKNTLSQVVDAVIVELGGFAVFNDKEKQAFLRKLAKERTSTVRRSASARAARRVSSASRA